MGASAKILLYVSKKYKDEKHPVLLRILINRKPKYYNIGSNLKCIPEQWDEQSGIFKKSFYKLQRSKQKHPYPVRKGR
jgi:hypothetical protein